MLSPRTLSAVAADAVSAAEPDGALRHKGWQRSLPDHDGVETLATHVRRRARCRRDRYRYESLMKHLSARGWHQRAGAPLRSEHGR